MPGACIVVVIAILVVSAFALATAAERVTVPVCATVVPQPAASRLTPASITRYPPQRTVSALRPLVAPMIKNGLPRQLRTIRHIHSLSAGIPRDTVSGPLAGL